MIILELVIGCLSSPFVSIKRAKPAYQRENPMQTKWMNKEVPTKCPSQTWVGSTLVNLWESSPLRSSKQLQNSTEKLTSPTLVLLKKRLSISLGHRKRKSFIYIPVKDYFTKGFFPPPPKILFNWFLYHERRHIQWTIPPCLLYL